MAHLGVTVAAVIHQPGAQLFAGLDDLLLLGRGGRSVYYGPQAGVQAYFESIGFRLPERVRPGCQLIMSKPLTVIGHMCAQRQVCRRTASYGLLRPVQ